MQLFLFGKKLLQNLQPIFKQGLSPASLALSIALAILFGVFPFFYIPTLLVSAAAIVFRLNVAVMLTINYMVLPLQIILFIPYVQIGKWVFGVQTHTVSFNLIVEAFKKDGWHAITHLFDILATAIGGWCISSIPFGLLLYVLLYTAIVFYQKKRKSIQL